MCLTSFVQHSYKKWRQSRYSNTFWTAVSSRTAFHYVTISWYLRCHGLTVSTVSRCLQCHAVTMSTVSQCVRCYGVYGVKVFTVKGVYSVTVSTVSRCQLCQGVYGVTMSTVSWCLRCHGGYGVMVSRCQGVYSVTVLKRHGVYGAHGKSVLLPLNYSYCISPSSE